jgi:hypothetical protein
MRLDYPFALLDIRDCECGLRYARHVIGLSQTQIGSIDCTCGESLEVWRGRYWLDFEPEERTEPVN